MDRPFLSILTDEGVRRVPLGDDPVTIGRAEENTIVIFDLQASRFHCEISQAADGRWLVKDLDSRNGTKLNGKRITEAVLGKGDVVRIGTTEIRLVMVASEPLPPPGPIGAAAPPPSAAAATPAAPAVAPFRSVSHPLDPPSALTPLTAPPNSTSPGPRSAPVALSPKLKPSRTNGKGSLSDPRSPTLLPMADASKKPAGEKLDELEIVEDEPAEVVDLASYTTTRQEEDAPIKVEIEPARRAAEETKVALVVPQPVDPVQVLRELAEALPATSPQLDDIALLDARCQVPGPGNYGQAWTQCADAAMLLRQAFVILARSRATELHLEPRMDESQLRLRVDGTMADLCRLAKPAAARLLALVKLLGEIDAQPRNIIQEGHFYAQAPGRRIEYRVSLTPAILGQKLVLRAIDNAGTPLHLCDLQMPLALQEEAARALACDNGLVLVAGPASSGRTTSLYALLRDVGISSRNVTAIEDPVEAEIDGVTQVLVNADQGHTFSALLRSLLRQDPDVVMVGELRDPETARAAIQASTGRLLLSSLYARDAAGAAARLAEWGIEPYAVASSLQLVVAQRLVRQLCPHCKRGVKPTPEQLARMGAAGEGIGEIFAPTGCPKCLKTGFAGRRAFFEAMIAGDEVRDAIHRATGPRDIEKALSTLPIERLAQAGYRLVAQGVTPIEEMERSLGPQPRKPPG